MELKWDKAGLKIVLLVPTYICKQKHIRNAHAELDLNGEMLSFLVDFGATNFIICDNALRVPLKWSPHLLNVRFC